MDFTLKRDPNYTPDSALGMMIGADGKNGFCSLERLYDGKPKIPAGTYDCVFFDSPHLGYRVYTLVNVPGHTNILIHIANTWEDLEGCIGIGLSRMGDMILHSKDAFCAFMALQAGIPVWDLKMKIDLPSFKLTIED